jgi:DNA-directed RNA polymerase subunit RPC12/RpoP
MSTYNHVLTISRIESEKIESKNPLFQCNLCSRNILFKTKRQVMHHLTRTHGNEISKDDYMRIRKIVRTIEQGHQEGFLVL